MGSEEAKNLRRQGIAAAKAGDKEQARSYLQRSLRIDPLNEAAWIWLASVARDRRERLFCFQKLLEVNPRNETALQALSEMGITPPQAARPSPTSQQTQPAPIAIPRPIQPMSPPAARPGPQQPGVPVPDPDHLSSLQPQVDYVLREYRLGEERVEGVQWVKKTRRRAGERDSMYLRIYVWSGIIGVVAAILIIGGLVVWNTPALRGIVFAPTWTPTYTPTLTPTYTPGFSPTPSPSPELTSTPRPTIDPSITPGGTVQAVPTRIYPEINNRRLSDAVNLIDRGQYAIALPTLAKERENTELSFDPAPYYYEAMALLGTNDPDSALGRLEEAESRLGEAPNRNFKPLVDAGFAQVYIALAERALKDGDNADVRDQLEAAQLRAESALDGDPLLVPAYLALAKRYTLDGRSDDAIDILNQGLSVQGLGANLNLIVQRGEIYFDQGEYDLAEQDAYTALYVDPTIEDAYLLQIKAVLARGDAGLAVIYSNNYLFFYPGSAEGFKLRADARIAEGNPDLALIDYTQALAAKDVSPATVPSLLGRAKLYMDLRRYDDAQTDLSRAYSLDNDPATRALRMQAAFQAGNYRIALSDASALLGSGVVPDAQIQFVRAQILVDQSNASNTQDLNEALTLLNNAPASARDKANEFRARAQFLLGDYQQALQSVDAALNTTETGSRRFLRGQILEALEKPEEAIREYEWVVSWSEIYPFPFLPQARSHLNALLASLPTPTPTSSP